MTLSVAPNTSTSTYQINVSGVSGTLNTEASTQIKVAFALIPMASLSPTSLIFNEVVGGTSKAQAITLSNPGTTELTIKKIVASSEFVVSSNTCGNVLLAGTKCTIDVAFAPSQPGVRLGTLRLRTMPRTARRVWSLSGTGTGTSARHTHSGQCDIFRRESRNEQSGENVQAREQTERKADRHLDEDDRRFQCFLDDLHSHSWRPRRVAKSA